MLQNRVRFAKTCTFSALKSRLSSCCHGKHEHIEWFQKLPKELPILLISGAQDPVGEWSKGIEAISRKLAETGHDRVTTKLYPDCRHEILNELNKSEVMVDILSWMQAI